MINWYDRHTKAGLASLIDKQVAELEQVKRERDETVEGAGNFWAAIERAEKAEAHAEAAERLAGARVKALLWEDAISDLIGPDTYFSRAVTAFGSYRTEQRLAGKWTMTTPSGDGAGNIVHHESLESAKAAAQADYERRILSALAEPAGEAEPVAWRWFNNCASQAVEALRYLSTHDRPSGGEQTFNRAHLLQIADELERDMGRIATTPPASAIREAEKLIAQVEERFPNWLSYRDLIDCIDCTLSELRRAQQ